MSSTTVWTVLNPQTCIACGVAFGIAKDYDAELRRNHKMFYCPNGHQQYYPSKTEAEKLRDELTRERAQHDQTRACRETWRETAGANERRAIALKGHHTRLKNRVAAGVCPCCKRSFQNVKRHMTNKHPHYAERPE